MAYSSVFGINLNLANCRTVIVYLSTALLQVGLTVATKCLKDVSLGDGYEANVYYCEEEEKPECCEVDNSATCCEAKSEKNFREQFQLWGILGVAIVIIAFVVVCWRKDTYLCEGSTLKERFTNSCRKRKKSGDEDSLELKVSHPKSTPENKYNPDKPNSALSKRESTSLTTRNIDPIMTSHNEIQISDVDSGRGSVASSASHSARANEKTSETVGEHSIRPGDANTLFVQPKEELKEQGAAEERNHRKKHKSKKKSKSKDKDLDSDQEDGDDNGEYSTKKDKSSKKKKKSKSKHSHEGREEIDISNV